jgi:predicted RND superfamily exporter protein
MSDHAPPGLQWEIAGYSRLFADMEELLVKGQVYSLWGALILIFLLMLLLWRSLGSALLCMIPNISPILLIFIVMGVFGLWLDMATAMIASVAVGIAVDDTIHVYHGYISRLNAGAQPIQALARTFSQAGRAVVTTTIILSAQFMILISSLFQPTTHFGLLTSVGLWAALVFDLLLLPAIIILTATLKTGFSR